MRSLLFSSFFRTFFAPGAQERRYCTVVIYLAVADRGLAWYEDEDRYRVDSPADEKAAMSNNVKMLLVVHGMRSRGWGLSEGMWPSDLDTLVFLEKVRRVSECQSATTPQTKAKAKGTFNIRDKMRVVVEAGGGAEAGDGMAVGELVCRRLNEDQWRLLQELMVGEKRHLYADSYMFHSGLG